MPSPQIDSGTGNSRLKLKLRKLSFEIETDKRNGGSSNVSVEFLQLNLKRLLGKIIIRREAKITNLPWQFDPLSPS